MPPAGLQWKHRVLTTGLPGNSQWCLRKADMKVLRRLGALGRKQKKMFLWSRLEVTVDTVERAWVPELPACQA